MTDIIAKIDPKTDSEIGTSNFIGFWPDFGKVYFEHYKTKMPAQDLIFGIPLTVCVRNTDIGVPSPIRRCFEEIESRGIYEEGIYRVTANKQELNELKVMLELDHHAVNLKETSVHLLAGIVKLFFRELPEPLLIFQLKERVEYSSAK
jgi:hypothetical protein